jgi:hypothetical protein
VQRPGDKPVGVDLTATPEAKPGRPFYATWWFWTAVTAVAAGTVTAILIARRSDDPCNGAGMQCLGVK